MGKDASADQVGTTEARKPGLFGRLVGTALVGLLVGVLGSRRRSARAARV